MTHPLNTMKLRKYEYLTPPYILQSLGEFDLDPCSPIVRPWPTAKKHFTIKEDGLSKSWNGRVWLNPPYGRYTGDWISKLLEHGNGIALIFSRTDVDFFHSYIFNKANGIFFIKGRITFCNIKGKRYPHNSGAPSCLVAYGLSNAEVLRNISLPGVFTS